jgi:small subunit ribosomal protein S3
VGQKVHPLGFRLQTTQKTRSNWFTTFKNYPTFLEEDQKIREYLITKNKQTGISKIEIRRNGKGDKIEIEIHTARPGLLVGKSGQTLAETYKNLQRIIAKDESLSTKKTIIIKVSETKNPDADANLIGDFIVEQLEKRIAFRRVVRKAVERLQKANVQGVKIQISGRLNGAEIARSEWVREGRVPLHTMRADIDYAEKSAETAYGIIGIKVWLFKGEILKFV